MRPAILRLSPIVLALTTLFMPLTARATGLGEIALHSKIGQPVRAEIPIVGNQEGVNTACFSLAPARESDISVLSDARIKLVRDRHIYRLLITSHLPVNDPIFMLSVRAGCGVELQRDFVLMPEPPVDRAEAYAPTALPTSRSDLPASTVKAPAGPSRTLQAASGETLEAIAENLVPDDLIRQRRMLGALKRANPQLDSTTPLDEGTVVRIPNLRRQAPAPRPELEAPPPRPAKARASAPRDQETPSLRKAEALPAKAPPGAGSSDRLVLDAPPADLQPGQKAGAPKASQAEVEERILKLETTLHLLNEEVSKLNQALALTAETVAAQQKLQTAMANQKGQGNAVSGPVPPPPPPHESSGGWLELILSALGGGLIAAGAAHFAARRRERQMDEELPLAVEAVHFGHHAQARDTVATPPPLKEPVMAANNYPPPPQPAEDSSGLSGFSQIPDKDVEVDEDDHNSTLELAELMLSFGRIRGAAETLATYIDESSPTHIRPWLMLLDLYRRGNMREEFETLAPRVAERFNAHIPAWEDTPNPVTGLKSLEDYAHIVWRLVHTWGSQACLDYLYDLVKDTRTGQRSGFPLEVVEEIAFLMRILEEGYGLQRAE